MLLSFHGSVRSLAKELYFTHLHVSLLSFVISWPQESLLHFLGYVCVGGGVWPRTLNFCHIKLTNYYWENSVRQERIYFLIQPYFFRKLHWNWKMYCSFEKNDEIHNAKRSMWSIKKCVDRISRDPAFNVRKKRENVNLV